MARHHPAQLQAWPAPEHQEVLPAPGSSRAPAGPGAARAPADLVPDTSPAAVCEDVPAVSQAAGWPDAIERIVPPSGNMTVGPQQFWLGISRTGQQVTFWIDTTTVHMSIAGWRIKTVPSRLSAVDLASSAVLVPARQVLRQPPCRPDRVAHHRPAALPATVEPERPAHRTSRLSRSGGLPGNRDQGCRPRSSAERSG